MSEKVNIGYSVKVETKTRIDELAKATNRFPGHLIDLLVEQAWNNYEARQALRSVTVADQALAEEIK